MPHNFDVLCVGNATIDTFLTLQKADSHLRLLEETNELCIKFGEKISVEKAEVLVGGNAANVSVGLSRLGLRVGLIAEIGDDEFAQKILNSLSFEKVDTSKILQTKGQQSSFSTIINFKGERTIFSEHVERKHDFNFENIFAKWVYLTSVGEEWKNAYEKTINFVKNTNSKLIFNPGTIQIKDGVESIKNVLFETYILFLNKEEAQALVGNENKDIKVILQNLKEFGPKIVVITNGDSGAFALDSNNNFFTQEVIETEVIEKTGAGDAFSSGFVAGFLHNNDIKNAMLWGTKNSSSVIGKIGAQTGLLYTNSFKENAQ